VHLGRLVRMGTCDVSAVPQLPERAGGGWMLQAMSASAIQTWADPLGVVVAEVIIGALRASLVDSVDSHRWGFM
jgi:hypothetical protein